MSISLQEALGVPYLSQKLYSHNPLVLALMLAMAGTKQLPTSSTQYCSLILCLTQPLRWGDTPLLKVVLAGNSRVTQPSGKGQSTFLGLVSLFR